MIRSLGFVCLFGCSVSPGEPAPSSPVAAEVAQPAVEARLYPDLVARLETWRPAPGDTVDPDRAESLALLAGWIAEKRDAGQPAHLLFVCTHNSRRSHLGQLWAWAAAHNAGLGHVVTWSGGTEATAFNPRAVTAAVSHGFVIQPTSEKLTEKNLVYETSIGTGLRARAFSKRFDDVSNPTSGFAAVMVCSEADAACPFVPGAELRVSLPYLDPKSSDGLPEEAATYLAKSEEIGREMVRLMAMVPAPAPATIP